MIGRRRTRRPRGSSCNPSSLSASKAVGLGMAVVLASSAIYLFCTHTFLSRDGSVSIRGNNPNVLGEGEGEANGQVDAVRLASMQGRASSDPGGVPYDGDPRFRATDDGDESAGGATGPLDYIELQCSEGKPDVDMSYWKDIPIDKHYESPWAAKAKKARAAGRSQYVTFEPDHGGFNNIRMAMETVLVFARETGRTLVMPAAQKFYLLNRPAVEFADMFPIENLEAYMDVMSMEDFLRREGMTGRLGKKPPDGQVTGLSTDVLHDYLREVADFKPVWDHMTEALIFGPSPDNPAVPDDAESQAWLAKFVTGKRTHFGYTDQMQGARHIHFRSGGQDRTGKAYRVFTHFYTFVGFSDPVASRHHRRLVRDVVHFREGLFCIAAGIVARVRAAGGGTPGRWSGWYGEGGGLHGGGEVEQEGGVGVRRAGFSTFHIRRGDFQYTKMKPPASTIVAATKDLILPGEVLYIATDERDKSFFDDFREDHQLFFLDDFKDLLGGIDPSYYLMIDTIVASQGRAFIGTWRSTFTGYITRLRGYYRFPTHFSWYYWDETVKDYQPVSLDEDTTPRQPFFMREWPVAWDDIDQDVWA